MKMIRVLLAVSIMFACFAVVPAPKTAEAVVGWVGAGGSPYIGNANPQPIDISVSNNSGGSWGPSLALDPSGNPCIAWEDNTPGNDEIFFARWNGSSWVNASGATLTATNANVSNNSGGSYRPFLALDSSSNPCIVWSDYTPGNSEIFFARWNGSSWVNVSGATLTATNGNVSNNSGDSYGPSLVLDSSSNPCIAWTDRTPGNDEIFFARWNGFSWVNVSGAIITATNANVSNNSGWSEYPSLALDPSGNPCIAWEDNTPGNYEIFFTRWNGASWVNASGVVLTATNSNVSSNSGCSWYLILTLDPSGDPCIAWCDNTPGNYEIFFSRWNGSSWVNVSGTTLTATNGNVSNNSGYSWYPSLTLDPSGNPCITWYDNTLGNYEILFARWNGSSWVNVSGAH